MDVPGRWGSSPPNRNPVRFDDGGIIHTLSASFQPQRDGVPSQLPAFEGVFLEREERAASPDSECSSRVPVARESAGLPAAFLVRFGDYRNFEFDFDFVLHFHSSARNADRSDTKIALEHNG